MNFKPTKENANNYVSQIGTDITLISFLAVITVFFIGALIPKFDSYDLSIKIPISFFIISTLALLFAALILSNASQRITEGNYKESEKYLSYGYAFSEYLGVYLLTLSIPLTVNIITADMYLRTVTFLAVILGLLFYQLMGFSNIKDNFSKNHKKLSILSIILAISLFFSQIYNFHFVIISIIFIVYILLITLFAPIDNFQ